jgi:hypothetical protein
MDQGNHEAKSMWSSRECGGHMNWMTVLAVSVRLPVGTFSQAIQHLTFPDISAKILEKTRKSSITDSQRAEVRKKTR